MASGATCVQRLDGSRDSAIHTKESHFATFFIDAKAEISVAESRSVIRKIAHANTTPERVFDNDPSAGSPTETLLRLLIPLNDKVQWTSRDVAGSEPPMSPRSEHFSGPFNQ
ncbi:hypothetical protein Vadar_031126 [Vaccinium darrowii]|uniref:Uncharacterized protein n=1 Tax=Vaccinium darrowii TaxID=229202 RepID=A0ACB7ZFD3_9ERIC|nr:hypothetical protein Vadar_031126 [Vaccinium darrowii]